VPQGDLPGDQELVVAVGRVRALGRRERTEVDAAQLAQHPVVEQDVRAVQPSDHQVLVVARVRKDRGVCAVAVGGPGHILMHPAGTELGGLVEGDVVVGELADEGGPAVIAGLSGLVP
jgi:hypothetical protein